MQIMRNIVRYECYSDWSPVGADLFLTCIDIERETRQVGAAPDRPLSHHQASFRVVTHQQVLLSFILVCDSTHCDHGCCIPLFSCKILLHRLFVVLDSSLINAYIVYCQLLLSVAYIKLGSIERPMRKLATLVGNDNRINSYLDAILNAYKSADGDRPFLLLHECVHFSPAHYFIKEVITSYDKADLYKTWPRVCGQSRHAIFHPLHISVLLRIY